MVQTVREGGKPVKPGSDFGRLLCGHLCLYVFIRFIRKLFLLAAPKGSSHVAWRCGAKSVVP